MKHATSIYASLGTVRHNYNRYNDKCWAREMQETKKKWRDESW
jgi:hypothetical protein